MLKAEKYARQGERERFFIPKTVQRSIPIRRLHEGGIWQAGQKLSKSWAFSDINYSVAGHDDQLDMFLSYCGLLNALPTDATAKITLNNRPIDEAAFSYRFLMKGKPDGLDHFRGEYNGMVRAGLAQSSFMTRERYITVSSLRRNTDEAGGYFDRVGGDLAASFDKLGSILTPLSGRERLHILHDFFHPGRQVGFRYSPEDEQTGGNGFLDAIAPKSMRFRGDHFRIGEQFGRVLYLQEYATFIKDSMLIDLTDLPRNLMVSLDIIPVPTDEAMAEMQKRVMAVESDITRWQQRQNMNSNYSAAIPYDMEQMRRETKEFLDDLTTRDQRMMFVVVTLVHIADSKEQLDTDTETLLSIGRKHLCTFAVLKQKQEDGLNTALPYGLRRIDVTRTLTTECTAVLMPYNCQEILHPGGVYLGVNPISGSPILCDRSSLLNGNGFILGVSGSGKSVSAKQEIIHRILNTDDDVIVLDPEQEYNFLQRMGGEIVYVGPGHGTHINAMGMVKGYGAGDNPITAKSEFILTLCEQAMGAGLLRAREKSLLDRCASNVLRPYVQRFQGRTPVLSDLHAELMKQPEPEAHDLALCLELFTSGSLNIFAHPTNVNMDSRVLVFDLYDLGKALKPMGMLVVLDAILNRVIQNRARGRRTHIFIDEIYMFFANEYSSNFLSESWKRFRKYGAQVTGITQNLEDCLRSHMARTMLANSEYLVMLNQAPTDRAELGLLLNISDTLLAYITNADAGRGLVKVGPVIAPFVNDLSRDTELYRLISTKPGEGVA